MEDSFRFLKAAGYNETCEVSHGRIETRKCTIITDLTHIEEPKRCEDLSVLIKMESERCFKATGIIEKAICYYIASKPEDVAFCQKNISNHWAIGNKLHRILSVVFQEDSDRGRNKNAEKNLSLINKVAINILKNDQTRNISIRRKKNVAAWDLNYLRMLMKF